jgi:hypothetical protein
MALDVNDLAMLKGMDQKGGLSPYEQFDMARHQAKKPSGVAIAGLTVASVGAAAAIGAWIFGPLYGNAKAGQAKEAAQSAKELAAAQYQAALQLLQTQNQNTQATIDRLISSVAAERNERIAGDLNITTTINDTQSGQQAASQSQTTAVDNAVSQVMSQTFADAITGRSSLNATPVQIYSAPQPCGCPGGCGCGQ